MMLYKLFPVSYYYSNAYFLFCIFIQSLNTINLVCNGGDNIYECTQEVILVYLPLYKAGMTHLIQNTAFNTRNWYFTRSMQFITLKWPETISKTPFLVYIMHK